MIKPSFAEREEGFGDFFERIYWRTERTKAPGMIFVDEVNAVTNFRPNGGPASFRRCFTEGEGLGLGMMAGCQDPVNLQREMLSQLDHLFAFRIQRDGDRKLLSNELGVKMPQVFPDKHGFFYRSNETPAVYFPDIQHATGHQDVIL